MSMTTSATGLGGPLGVGRTAEVFARGEDEVVKVLRPGFPDLLGEHEAAVAALVAAAGVGAPRFVGTTRIEGRFGIVYERLVGPSMLDRLGRNPWEIDRLAGWFADLHATMHDVNGAGLPDQKAEVRGMIERAGARLQDGARQAALRRLGGLPGGDAICHGDMHPGNVLVTSRGAVVIDWTTASCGNPAGDVARTLFLLGHSGIPPSLPRVQRSLIGIARRRFCSVYLRQYRRLRPLDQREVDAWRLPILAARLGEEIEAERATLDVLIQRDLELPDPFA
jgi:aminoglycoside phosphotransferase (APT) family kinase protein